MAQITITINTSNEAFETHAEWELARILRELAKGIEGGSIDDDIKLRDINGNEVGQLTVSDDE